MEMGRHCTGKERWERRRASGTGKGRVGTALLVREIEGVG